MVININYVVGIETKKLSNNSYRIAAQKKRPQFVEYEYKIFITEESSWDADSNITAYVQELKEKYAYPYTS